MRAKVASPAGRARRCRSPRCFHVLDDPQVILGAGGFGRVAKDGSPWTCSATHEPKGEHKQRYRYTTRGTDTREPGKVAADSVFRGFPRPSLSRRAFVVVEQGFAVPAATAGLRESDVSAHGAGLVHTRLCFGGACGGCGGRWPRDPWGPAR